MRIIRATPEYTNGITKAQFSAYEAVNDHNPSARSETASNIESRIMDESWRVFIGINDDNEVITSISYLLNHQKDAAYACRWFSIGKGLAAYYIFIDSMNQLRTEGIRRLFARTFKVDRRVKIYKRGRFREASSEEITECKLMVRDIIPSMEDRIYLVRDL